MAKYKICKTCKTQNELTKFRCTKCKSTVFEEPKEKRVQSKERLKLIFEDMPIKLESDDIVGREAKGDKLLALMTTVSRQHAKFLFEDERWFVKDLNSANGTYLESVDNRISEKTEIRDGDRLFLSRSVEIIVKI